MSGQGSGQGHDAPRAPRTAVVIVASTSAAAGISEDRTGPKILAWLRQRGFETGEPRIVADGAPFGEALRQTLGRRPDLVLTTGGTGVSPDDRTPEETLPLLDAQLPGLMEELRRVGASKMPTALLTRGVAGFAGRTFVMNLPGSPGGVADGLAVLEPVLDHLLQQRAGAGGHGDGRSS